MDVLKMMIRLKDVLKTASLGAAILLVSGIGCSVGKVSTPSRFYVLANPLSAVDVDAKTNRAALIHVGKVEVSRYLTKPHIVSRSGSHEIQSDEFNRWAEPIEDGIQRVLNEALIGQLGDDQVLFDVRDAAGDYKSVAVTVHQFELVSGTGAVTLNGLLRVCHHVNRTNDCDTQYFEFTEALAGSESNMRHVATAMSRALGQLAISIANE